MIKLIKSTLACFLCISFMTGCTTSFLTPAQGMGVEQPKIFLKKTRTSFEASASSDFSGDIEVDGEYSKEDGSFKGKLKANVTSDASTPTTAQVEKIKAMENAYNKYADNMTALGIAQAQAWQAAFESLTQMVPNTVGVIKANPKPSEPSAFDNMLAVWNSLTPEQKQAFLDKFINSAP